MPFLKPAILAWIIWISLGIQSLAHADANPVLELRKSGLIAVAAIRFTEPSGLAFDTRRSMLWSVSDNAKSVFAMPVGEGRVTRSLPLGYKELEGVSVGFSENSLLFVREKGNLIIQYDLVKNSVSQAVRLSDLEGYGEIARKFGPDEENKGLEGITIDVAGHRIFVVKEARPRLLVQISPDLSRIERHWKLSADAGFRVAGLSDKKLDISGLSFDPGRQAIWMASDKAGGIFLFDLQTGIGHRIEVRPAQGMTVPDLRGIEGIAINEAQDGLIAVTDAGNKSMRFDFLLH